ncbi:MAG TPA: hypothetical protein VN905_11945 [Candidatus Binatia bacterium]|nr:hypothetical protein [Candidatus Binatia bacterium]
MLKLAVKDIVVMVHARFAAEGSVLRETIETSASFEIGLTIESDEPPDKLEKLVRVAHSGCYAEAALRGKAPIRFINTINGRAVA